MGIYFRPDRAGPTEPYLKTERTPFMACFIIGAGSFYGLPVPVQKTDTVIAADGGWHI